MSSINVKNLSIAIVIPCVMLAIALWIDHHNNSLTLTYCALCTLIVHLCIGLPSVLVKTEKFYDITGSIAVWAMISVAVNLSPSLHVRDIILSTMAGIWTTRLGLFLLHRIHQQKIDRRFNDIKKNPLSFLIAWEMSAAWTFITLLCVLTAISSPLQSPINTLDYILISAWLAAFLIEAIADWQKLQFKKTKSKTPFIQTGLWRYSRHPNYFGEISMWICVACLAAPNLSIATSVCLLSPAFIYWLLTQVSGINLLEVQSDKKYGTLKSYQDYKASTPRLIPNFWKS